MNIPDIINNENGNTYILVRNYMEYSIDDSIEDDDIIIDLNDQNGEWFLVGVEIIGNNNNINLDKIRYISDREICYIKFYDVYKTDEDIVTQIKEPHIEIHRNKFGNIYGIIIKREKFFTIDIENDIKNMKI